MGRKNAITPFASIDAGDMSGDILGAITDLMHLDNVCYQAKWSGTSPLGEIQILVTNDDASNPAITPVWSELDFGSTISIASDSGEHLININQIPAKFMRPKYARTSGTGTLTVTMTSKMLGG